MFNIDIETCRECGGAVRVIDCMPRAMNPQLPADLEVVDPSLVDVAAHSHPDLLSGMLAACAEGLGEPAPDHPAAVGGRLEIHRDGTATAVGVVVSNEQRCIVDAQCWLVVAIGETQARVVYVE